MQLEYVKNELDDLSGKKILDIGCATGELAFQLAKSKANLTGFDLNEDLIRNARINKKNPNLHFQKGNMLELKRDFIHESFDGIICFGNTIVHLQNYREVENMFQQVYDLLKPNKKFLLQILNYDYILSEEIKELPLIETEKIKFIRQYNFEKDKIQFNTQLHIKIDGEIISNSANLLPLKHQDLNKLLLKTGFTELKCYANFSRSECRGKHIPLVLSCKKPAT
jgi:2-polyprenyl-3-methyl-5-hydroxy-6-metoxy-1,4-benzoquinol methylase